MVLLRNTDVLRSWWARLGTLSGAAMLAVFVPVTAWASTGPDPATMTAARRNVAGGGLTALCCLAVIAAIVLLIFLAMRRRGSGRR